MAKKKKRGPRGPYKKRAKTTKANSLPKVNITFLNLGTTHARRPGVKVANTCISMDSDTAKEMGLKSGSYVVVGKANKDLYLTAKPKNVAAGHVLRASKTGRLTTHIKATDYKLTTGIYQLGKPVIGSMPTEQGEFVEVNAYPLIID